MDLSALKVLVDLSLMVFTAYAVYALIVGGLGWLLGIQTTWMEKVEAGGGAVFIAGTLLWSERGVDYALAMMLLGAASFLVPRLVLIAKRGAKYGA